MRAHPAPPVTLLSVVSAKAATLCCYNPLDPGDMDTPLHALAVPDADSDAHLPKARN
jgi:hypothetical protein